ncbi:MAG: DUF4350 domain-containing protein [Thermoplasmata archaeon]
MDGRVARWLLERKTRIVLMTVPLIILLAGVSDFLTGVRHLSAYDDGWDDLSGLRSSLQRTGYITSSIVSTPVILRASESSVSTQRALAIIGLEKPYLSTEIEAIVDFVKDGGSLLLADDFGYGGALASRFGVGISGRRLWSASFERNPAFVRVNVSLDGVEYTILLNEPTALESVSVGEVLALTDEESWLDNNSNGERDIDEDSASYAVAAWIRHGYGSVLIFSDPGIFINDMWTRADNARFIMNCIRKFFPDAREFIFEESRHRPATFREGMWRTGMLLEVLALDNLWGRATLSTITILALILAVSRVRTPAEWHHEDNLYDFTLYHLADRRFRPEDRLRLRRAFLEKVRISMGLYPDEFERLGEAELSAIINHGDLLALVRDPDSVPLERMDELVDAAREWRRT